MNSYIKARVIKVALHMISTKQTVREIAQHFSYGKSTIHHDLSKKLPLINKELADEVRSILDHHTSTRHIRGGNATQRKWHELSARVQVHG